MSLQATNQEPFSGEINFPESFRRELSAKLNIRVSDVLDSIREPDTSEILHADGLKLRFYRKYIPQQSWPYNIVSYGRTENGILNVDMAWKISLSVRSGNNSGNPSEILDAFAKRFGLTISIGGTRQQFIWDEKFQIDGVDDEPIQIQNPDGHEFVQQIISRKISERNSTLVHCLLGMCIDLTRYRSSIV